IFTVCFLVLACVPPESTLFPYTTLFRSLDGIAQFADISGPGVAHENVHHFSANSADVLAVLGVDVAQDVLDKERNVVFVFAERRSEEHTSELQSHLNLVCRLLLEKKKKS